MIEAPARIGQEYLRESLVLCIIEKWRCIVNKYVSEGYVKDFVGRKPIS